MTEAQIRKLVSDGKITQAEGDQMLEALHLLQLQQQRQTLVEEEERRKVEFFEKLRTASPTVQKSMCQQKSNYLSALAAEEDDYSERRELSKRASRFNRAIRRSGVSQY